MKSFEHTTNNQSAYALPLAGGLVVVTGEGTHVVAPEKDPSAGGTNTAASAAELLFALTNLVAAPSRAASDTTH